VPSGSNRVLIATRSVGKLRELRPLFAERGLAVVDLEEAGIAESPNEDALEIHATFEENALAKASYFRRIARMPVFADDSGLVVPALGGEPGVLSKRWSGRPDLSGQPLDDENNRLLIERLHGVSDRRAHYVCAAAFAGSGRETVARGEVHGTIADAPRGTAGFGYDPYFVSDELGQTFGEVSREDKQRVSHRGRAFRALLAAIGFPS
jgi:XTP/dITP diphosphohydrolase